MFIMPVGTKSKRLTHVRQGGFTLIELLVAMAIFSFLLLIIIQGFLNIVRIYNQALASNMTQDSARTAMSEVVRAMRDSSGVIQNTTSPTPGGHICLSKSGSHMQQYWVTSSFVLMRSDDCATVAPYTNAQAITNSNVKVVNFEVVQVNSGPNVVKPEYSVNLKVASNNSTTIGTGASTVCSPNESDRTFCSTVSLSSGAVPR